MRKRKIVLVIFAIGTLFLFQGVPVVQGEIGQEKFKSEQQRVAKWIRERDAFFKSHQRSPLSAKDKKSFNGLKYYPFNNQYVFCGTIERYILHINNPKYYATFLTNKGTNKRYLRYGRFHFTLDGKQYALEIYKSILSDMLFIPFKDKTNGKETYEGGRYIDAEILTDYKMVLDFNMAYHPSCAYNEKFVCVLPPRDNMLDIEMRAGERLLNPHEP